MTAIVNPPNCKYIDWDSVLKTKCLHKKMKGLVFQKQCKIRHTTGEKCDLLEIKYKRPAPPTAPPQRTT